MTGLHRLPLDAVELPDGRPLLSTAAVSAHTSLAAAAWALDTVAADLLGTDGPPAGLCNAGAYDSRLAVGEEREVYTRLFAPVIDVGTRGKFLRLHERTDPDGVLSVGLHGTTDQHTGWGQQKVFADDTVITAAEALSMTFPRTCVLASCNTALEEQAEGLELGGFPLAMSLRGALTIVGGLYRIPDRSTSQIMRRFWPLLHRLEDPVQALRLAKLDWLGDQSVPVPLRDWAGLVVYGGAHL
jgi:hypothetical protein